MAEYFSRKLFKGYCIAVNDAYLDATIPDDAVAESYADPKTVREQLSTVAANAARLRESIDRLDRSALSLLGHHYFAGPPRALPWHWKAADLADMLDALIADGAAASAAASGVVQAGARKAPLTHLILQVANMAVVENGLTADSKQTGPLHTLCRIALEVPEYKDAFGEPASLRDSIRSVLRQEARESSQPWLRKMFRS